MVATDDVERTASEKLAAAVSDLAIHVTNFGVQLAEVRQWAGDVERERQAEKARALTLRKWVFALGGATAGWAYDVASQWLPHIVKAWMDSQGG